MKKILCFFTAVLLSACGLLPSDSASDVVTGCSIDLEKYDNVEVYEALAPGNKNEGASKVSLLRYAPRRMSQGQQGSCVAWATAYAACTINEARARGISGDDAAFSPSFLYNQVKHSNCQGSYYENALSKVVANGLVPFSEFKYDDSDCSRLPSQKHFEIAKNFKIKGYNRLTTNDYEYVPNIEAIKQHLQQGAPVVISMSVPKSFCSAYNIEVWSPESNESNYTYENYRAKGILHKMDFHAMCLVGYDDNKYGGAFHVMNSWGDDWGKDGLCWISYKNFKKYGLEAYGIFPTEARKKTNENNQTDFKVEFGLIDADSKQNIPLSPFRGNIFKTISPIKKNSKFKIEVSNSEACYIYVFGQETDGSVYLLFPYLKDGETTSKYSPYCGIVGTRHFPSGKASLRADEIGNVDYMSVVVSKNKLDYVSVLETINNQRGDFETKLKKTFAKEQFQNPKFRKTNSTVSFEAKSSNSQYLLPLVIAIDKK